MSDAQVKAPPAACTPSPSGDGAGPHQARPPLVLTERERDLIELLRRIDFWRAGKSRFAMVVWNGVRAMVFDGQQIT